MSNTTTEIKNYINTLTDFQKEIVLEMRSVVLGVDKNIIESIKWSSIAFTANKNLCGFRVAKGHVTLVFFEGSSFNDEFKALEGAGAKVRSYKVKKKENINKDTLISLVKEALENQ